MMPGPVILPSDVLALAEIAPGDLTEAFLQSLGQLLNRALTKGNSVEPFVASLEKGTTRLGGQDPARTAPNPRVGSVIVEAGAIVARGHFQQDGGPHAEKQALAALGRPPAPGATLYVTLEPCSTAGRTGACTAAILAAGTPVTLATKGTVRDARGFTSST